MDRGPIYTETILGRFPVEPWNTFSNLIFLIVLLDVWRRLRRLETPPRILVLGLPILFLGFVGGTVYHATRSSDIWLFMDFVPISLLAMAASFHFWFEILKKRWLSVLLVFSPVILIRWFRTLSVLPRHYSITLGYVTLALVILLPAVLHCKNAAWRNASLLVSTVLLFAAALTCRTLDPQKILPMGTHFLWHLFGGLSVYCLMVYILYSSENSKTHEA